MKHNFKMCIGKRRNKSTDNILRLNILNTSNQVIRRFSKDKEELSTAMKFLNLFLGK